MQSRLDQALSGQPAYYQAEFVFAGIGRRIMDVIYFPVFDKEGNRNGPGAFHQPWHHPESWRRIERGKRAWPHPLLYGSFRGQWVVASVKMIASCGRCRVQIKWNHQRLTLLQSPILLDPHGFQQSAYVFDRNLVV
jgi:hypothetical protein